MDVKDIFKDNEKILEMVTKGEEISKIVSLESNKCSFLNQDIILQEKLGEGEYGKVYKIQIDGMGPKQYVIKESKKSLKSYYIPEESLEKDLQRLGITLEDLKKYQKNDEFEVETSSPLSPTKAPKKRFAIRSPILQTVTHSPKKFPAFPPFPNKEITIPAGSYICENEAVSEFLIGALLGELYRTGRCIHFFDVYTMFSCITDPNVENKKMSQYVIMDKIDGDMSKYIGCFSLDGYLKTLKGKNRIIRTKMFEEERDKIIDSLYIQTLFAMAAYQQEKYKVSHNDLHVGNVFVELIREDTEFNHQKLKNAEWFQYDLDVGWFNTTSIYIPATPIIVKIGDFGLSIKYSSPIIANYEIIRTGFKFVSDGEALVANQFFPSYDNVFFANHFKEKMQKYKMENPFIKACELFITNGKIIEDVCDKEYDRPLLSKLNQCKTPLEVLMGPVFKKYGTKPQSGNIVKMGSL
jgi:serine/threonine protein kinase